jgi:3-hydroxyacyl-CoA dehydrogenase
VLPSGPEWVVIGRRIIPRHLISLVDAVPGEKIAEATVERAVEADVEVFHGVVGAARLGPTSCRGADRGSPA